MKLAVLSAFSSWAFVVAQAQQSLPERLADYGVGGLLAAVLMYFYTQQEKRHRRELTVLVANMTKVVDGNTGVMRELRDETRNNTHAVHGLTSEIRSGRSRGGRGPQDSE